MDKNDFDLARMIATNSADIQPMLEKLVEHHEQIRDTFLSMIADAKRFDEDVDGDEVNGRAVMYIDYHLTVQHSSLQELCDLLLIKPGYEQSLFDAINAAIEEP